MGDFTKSYITDKFKIETGNEFTYTINNSNEKNSLYVVGDYLHKMYVRLTLPAIYSSSTRQFKWVKYIGYNIIKNVKCKDIIEVANSLFSYNKCNICILSKQSIKAAGIRKVVRDFI